MPQFLLALVILVGGLWFLRKLGKTPQPKVKPLLSKMAGGGIVGFAGLLALRGQTSVAVPLFIFGLGLLGHASAFPNGFSFGGRKQPGQKSRVETSLLFMELDHDSGTMDGQVKSGTLAGRALSSLTSNEVIAFYKQCRETNDQSQALFEAWLDRNRRDWREATSAGASSQGRASSRMTREKALQVLGLKEGAGADDIRAAHRRLMKNFHPDLGGSDFLAAQINEAKDVLLS